MDQSSNARAAVVRFSTNMQCSLDRLWSVFEDIAKLPKWVKGLERFEITSPPPHGEGATYDMVIREGRKLQTYHGKNLVWEPRVRVKEYMWGGSLKAGELITMEYLFEGDESGSVLHYENAFRAGFAKRLMFSVFGRAYCKGMINALKKEVES